MMRGVGCNPGRMSPGPGDVQFLNRWHIAANHPLYRADVVLQLDLGMAAANQTVMVDGFDDGRVEVHYNLHKVVKLFELPQEVQPSIEPSW